jgi:parallel beta-helix repeat protein
MKRAFIILLILLPAGLIVGLRTHLGKAQPRTWTVDDNGPADFTKIQSAIDAAGDKDRIQVNTGVYDEHIVIHKSITLFGENNSTTIIDGAGADTVILVTADNVAIRGFTVRNGHNGIYVISSRNCSVSANLVHDNRYGAKANQSGIYIITSSNCSVHANWVHDNGYGVRISRSQNCTVAGNYVFNNSRYGLNVNASREIMVEKNGASNNYFDGIGLFSSNNTIVRENTANGNSLFGIIVDGSSTHNVLYHNNLFGNGLQASSNPANSWDNDEEGNYWGDYEGADEDGDGVGDEPYINEKTQHKDSFPLIRPYVNDAFRSIDTEPPAAAFTFLPEENFANDTTRFDASSSYDAVGSNAIAGYEWRFGDGTTTTGMIANHTYLLPGNYTVVLTAVDMAGNVGSASSVLHVQSKDSENGLAFPSLTTGLVIAGMLAFTAIVYALWRKKT